MTATITLTTAQAQAITALDPSRTPQAIVQIHVDTWLAPMVADAIRADAAQVSLAYERATAVLQTDVKRSLGVVEVADAVKR